MRSRPGARRASSPPTRGTRAWPSPIGSTPATQGQPYAATVRFRGRREGIAGKPQPGDTFSVDERVERVVPGSGPVSVTTKAFGLNPGEWTVTAELIRAPGLAPTRATAGEGRPDAPPREVVVAALAPRPTRRSGRSARGGARSCA